MISETQSKAELVREYERQANGTDGWTRHAFGRTLYSDGMSFVAETCGAFWLLDVVASHQPPIMRKLRRLGERDFQVWVLEYTPKPGRSDCWTVRAWTDTPHADGSQKLAAQVIPYSDFPRELSPFKFIVENGRCMLSGER